MSGGKQTMSIPEAQATLEAFGKKVMARRQQQAQAEGQKNLAAGAAFLASNAKKPGVKTTASGLEYQVLQTGTGPKPKATDTVKVNYRGTLLDGSEFDSSAKNGGPASFQVTGVIPGWTEGLQLMNVGSKFVFWVPGKLAYGDSNRGPGGPNSMLKFEVELLSVGK
jgi:FKBP-type peptidyl-prolyl cis-trans isomerase